MAVNLDKKIKLNPNFDLTNKRDRAVIIILGLLLSIIQFLTNYYSDTPPSGLLTLLRGDVISYIDLSENLIQNGVYGFEGRPSVYRMPGFAIFYVPFRLFLQKTAAINALVIFQLLFSVIAKFLFSKIIFLKTKSNLYFLSSFFLLLIGSPLIFRNNILYAESLASSCLMLSLYFLFVFHTKRSTINLFFAGTFVALMIFLRPFTGIIIPLVLLYLYFDNEKKINLFYIKQSFLFILFFSILSSAWIYRNFKQFNEFIPLEKSNLQVFFCESSVCKYRKLIIKSGESGVFWDDNSVGTWFAPNEFLDEHQIKRPTDEIIPKYLLTNYLTIDTLKKARDLSNGIYDNIFGKTIAEQEAIRIFSMFNDTLKSNHPFIYHVYSRVTPIYDTFFQPGSPTKSLKYPFNVVTVFFNTITSFLVLIIGFFSFLYLFIIKGDNFLRLMLFFNAFSILFNDIIIMDHENRYILINYGIFVFTLLYTVHLSQNKVYLIGAGILTSIMAGLIEVIKMY